MSILVDYKGSTFNYFLILPFDLKVLQLIPDNWSIGLLRGFLLSSVRGSLNKKRTTHVQRMLARGENLLTKSEHIGMNAEQVTMTESK